MLFPKVQHGVENLNLFWHSNPIGKNLETFLYEIADLRANLKFLLAIMNLSFYLVYFFKLLLFFLLSDYFEVQLLFQQSTLMNTDPITQEKMREKFFG